MALDDGVESVLTEAFIEELIREIQVPKDRCVSCSEETEYEKSTHISQRRFYDRGIGQFCESCYRINCPDEIVNGEY